MYKKNKVFFFSCFQFNLQKYTRIINSIVCFKISKLNIVIISLKYFFKILIIIIKNYYNII